MIKEKYTVTGGIGFVGSALCEYLLNQGKEVTCIDVLDEKTSNPSTLSKLNLYPNFKFVHGSILDLHHLEQELGKPYVVIHTAAISSVHRSIGNPLEAFMLNAVGTFNVLEACRRNNIKRIHYVSTDEVFGSPFKRKPITEISPSYPRNPYAAGKLAGDGIVTAYGSTYGLEVTITNSVNNYGPNQSPDKLIPRLIMRGLAGNTLPVFGDGKQVREWLFVDDHVRAILHVIDHGKFGNRYCVGSGVLKQNMEIVNIIISELGLDLSVIEHVDDRPGSCMRYGVNTDKINRLGWEPIVDFDKGMPDTIQWYKNARDTEWWKYYMVVYPDIKA